METLGMSLSICFRKTCSTSHLPRRTRYHKTGKVRKELVALQGVRRGDSHLVQGPAADRTT